MPQVSIIMGVYNGERTLEASLCSILNQTFTDWEFIICDDGSTDHSYSILSNYAKQDSRIILLQNRTNHSLAASLNKCLEIAQGELIARMDADDISDPRRLEVQVEFLKQNPKYALVGTLVSLFNDNGNWGHRGRFGEPTKTDVFLSKSFIHPTIIIKKTALIAVGNYTVSNLTYRAEDYDLFCKLYFNGFIGFNINERLLFYREDNLSYHRKKYIYRINLYVLKQYWCHKLKLSKKHYLFCFKPLIAGMIPSIVMRYYHRLVFKEKILK